MDYSQLSDRDIDALVLQKVYGSQSADKDIMRSWLKGGFKFTSNPADAWPIIFANLIEVSPDYDFTDESEEELYATGLWTANHFEADGESYYQAHQNPLRAAMIVFLMMQDAKHA